MKSTFSWSVPQSQGNKPADELSKLWLLDCARPGGWSNAIIYGFIHLEHYTDCNKINKNMSKADSGYAHDN